jgi:hypothetical protein
VCIADSCGNREGEESVEQFLCGLLRDLEHHCVMLRDRLVTIPADPDVRTHALQAYREVEIIRREVVQQLHDPSLGLSILLPNHLQLYKRWSERVSVIESYPFLFVERYAPSDRQMTRLCQRLAAQVGWPLPPPLVAAFSNQYYWAMPEFNIICVPAAEGTTLLGLPDLCHELGHILLLAQWDALVGDFLRELASYILQEQRRVGTEQRPKEYRPLYNQLFMQWKDAWLLEFVSDMVATYLVGPAFGWQHVRLCAGNSLAAYHPTLGERADHPADEARLRGIVAVLTQMGAAEAGARITALWDCYLEASRETRPQDYEVCYPQALLESLAKRIIAGCRSLGVRGFDQPGGPPNDLPSLFGEAWERFLADSQTYAAWERSQIETLWQELDVGI